MSVLLRRHRYAVMRALWGVGVATRRCCGIQASAQTVTTTTTRAWQSHAHPSSSLCSSAAVTARETPTTRRRQQRQQPPWTSLLTQRTHSRATLHELMARFDAQEQPRLYAVYRPYNSVTHATSLPLSSSSSSSTLMSGVCATPHDYVTLARVLSNGGMAATHGKRVVRMLYELLQKPVCPQHGLLGSWDVTSRCAVRTLQSDAAAAVVAGLPCTEALQWLGNDLLNVHYDSTSAATTRTRATTAMLHIARTSRNDGGCDCRCCMSAVVTALRARLTVDDAVQDSMRRHRSVGRLQRAVTTHAGVVHCGSDSEALLLTSSLFAAVVTTLLCSRACASCKHEGMALLHAAAAHSQQQQQQQQQQCVGAVRGYCARRRCSFALLSSSSSSSSSCTRAHNMTSAAASLFDEAVVLHCAEAVAAASDVHTLTRLIHLLSCHERGVVSTAAECASGDDDHAAPSTAPHVHRQWLPSLHAGSATATSRASVSYATALGAAHNNTDCHHHNSRSGSSRSGSSSLRGSDTAALLVASLQHMHTTRTASSLSSWRSERVVIRLLKSVMHSVLRRHDVCSGSDDAKEEDDNAMCRLRRALSLYDAMRATASCVCWSSVAAMAVELLAHIAHEQHRQLLCLPGNAKESTAQRRERGNEHDDEQQHEQQQHHYVTRVLASHGGRAYTLSPSQNVCAHAQLHTRRQDYCDAALHTLFGLLYVLPTTMTTAAAAAARAGDDADGATRSGATALSRAQQSVLTRCYEHAMQTCMPCVHELVRSVCARAADSDDNNDDDGGVNSRSDGDDDDACVRVRPRRGVCDVTMARVVLALWRRAAVVPQLQRRLLLYAVAAVCDVLAHGTATAVTDTATIASTARTTTAGGGGAAAATTTRHNTSWSWWCTVLCSVDDLATVLTRIGDLLQQQAPSDDATVAAMTTTLLRAWCAATPSSVRPSHSDHASEQRSRIAQQADVAMTTRTSAATASMMAHMCGDVDDGSSGGSGKVAMTIAQHTVTYGLLLYLTCTAATATMATMSRDKEALMRLLTLLATTPQATATTMTSEHARRATDAATALSSSSSSSSSLLHASRQYSNLAASARHALLCVSTRAHRAVLWRCLLRRDVASQTHHMRCAATASATSSRPTTLHTQRNALCVAVTHALHSTLHTLLLHTARRAQPAAAPATRDELATLVRVLWQWQPSPRSSLSTLQHCTRGEAVDVTAHTLYRRLLSHYMGYTVTTMPVNALVRGDGDGDDGSCGVSGSNNTSVRTSMQRVQRGDGAATAADVFLFVTANTLALQVRQLPLSQAMGHNGSAEATCAAAAAMAVLTTIAQHLLLTILPRHVVEAGDAVATTASETSRQPTRQQRVTLVVSARDMLQLAQQQHRAKQHGDCAARCSSHDTVQTMTMWDALHSVLRSQASCASSTSIQYDYSCKSSTTAAPTRHMRTMRHVQCAVVVATPSHDAEQLARSATQTDDDDDAKTLATQAMCCMYNNTFTPQAHSALSPRFCVWDEQRSITAATTRQQPDEAVDITDTAATATASAMHTIQYVSVRHARVAQARQALAPLLHSIRTESVKTTTARKDIQRRQKEHIHDTQQDKQAHNTTQQTADAIA